VDFTTKNMLFELFNIGTNVEVRFLFLNNLLYHYKGQKRPNKVKNENRHELT